MKRPDYPYETIEQEIFVMFFDALVNCMSIIDDAIDEDHDPDEFPTMNAKAKKRNPARVALENYARMGDV